MTGHEHILFEEAEIQFGPGLWGLIDAEVYVDWWVSGGDLHWALGTWTGPERKPFHSDMQSPLTRELTAYANQDKRKRYIANTISERNGIVLDPNGEHRKSQREFV